MFFALGSSNHHAGGEIHGFQAPDAHFYSSLLKTSPSKKVVSFLDQFGVSPVFLWCFKHPLVSVSLISWPAWKTFSARRELRVR